MARPYNFSAGPAVLPEAVLLRAQEEIVNWRDTGMSVMEMSHRGKEFISIAQKAEADLRELMGIPENYKVLFLQGGATAQFAMVPMNMLRGKSAVDYINTGQWSQKAIKEAGLHASVNVAACSEAENFTTVPSFADWKLNPDAAYVHYTPNETIGGLEFHDIPDVGDVPLVADMSSNILSRPIDVSRFALIYAGAQKNIGPSGLTVVIVREDMLGDVAPHTPTLYNYANHAEGASMLNTPPTYAWYIAGLVFEWLKEQGGVPAMGTLNQRKSEKLYAAIDNSGFFSNPIDPNYRSRMNVPFTLADASLDAAFLSGADEAGLLTLKGHRSVGGMRASIYNAMPESGVDALIEYMQHFEKTRA